MSLKEKVFNKNLILGVIIGFVTFPVIIVGAAWLYVKISMGDIDRSLRPPEIPIEETIDLNWEIKNLSGRSINLAQEAAGKVIFINFWATWCPPCVQELPSIEDLFQDYGDRIFFACISTEEIKVLQKFVESNDFSLPIYQITGAPPEYFNTSSIPATFIVSRDGRIALKHLGGADWSDDTVTKYLDTLLADSPPSDK